jgi:hypothetical protein
MISIDNVTMKLFILRRVIKKPFTHPIASPNPNMMAITRIGWAASRFRLTARLPR